MVESITVNGCSLCEFGRAASDSKYGMDEVKSLVECWCDETNSPFDCVPLRSDGHPDVVQTLVTLFDWIGTFSFLRSSEAQRKRSAMARSNGNVVLAGLFTLHMQCGRMELAGTGSNATRLREQASKRQLHCPILSKAFEDAARTGSCASVREMISDGLATSDGNIETEWTKILCNVLRPFANWDTATTANAANAAISMPFDPESLTDVVVAKKTGLSLAGFFQCEIHDFKVDDSLFRIGMHTNDGSTLPHFAMQIATRSSTESNSLHLGTRFELFCDALFVAVCKRIKSKVVKDSSVFSGAAAAATRALHDIVIKGLCCGAVTSAQKHHPVLIRTLRQANPSILTSLPEEIALYTLKDICLKNAIDNFPRIVVNPSNGQPLMSNALRTIVKARTPSPGQMLTVDQLMPAWDSHVFPQYTHFMRAVVSMHLSSNAARQQILDSLPNVLSLMDGQPEITEENSDELWSRAKEMQLGVRQMFNPLAQCNKMVNNLRAVCKAYACIFHDFVFRPYVEIEKFDETATDVLGSPGLRGSPALAVNWTTRPHMIHVYFARKTLVAEDDGNLSEHWQYLNPAVVKVGCNTVKITAETVEDDCNKSSTSFSLLSCPRTRMQDFFARQVHGKNYQQNDLQSLANESIYSIGGGGEWTNRIRQADLFKLIVLWDRKFQSSDKHRAQFPSKIANTLSTLQSFVFKVRCIKTSSSLAATPTAPIRPVRYRVTFGNVAHERDKYTARDIRSFEPVISGTSESHYSSNISLKSSAVTKRANKRKVRTDADRSSR